MPFDNGIIPDFFINPVGRAIAALYPLPNRNVPFQNFVSSPILRDDNDSFDARVDHHLNRSRRPRRSDTVSANAICLNLLPVHRSRSFRDLATR